MMVPLRVIGTHTDITDRKKAEEELNQSEQKYRRVFPCSPSGNCHLQCQGRYEKLTIPPLIV